MPAPIETKVSAATIASAAAGLGLWALQTYVFHDSVPLPVVAAVTTVVPAVVTFAAGWLAPHTPRPELQRPDLYRAEDGPPEEGGRHALDDNDPQDIPAAEFINPAATRYESRGHAQD